MLKKMMSRGDGTKQRKYMTQLFFHSQTCHLAVELAIIIFKIKMNNSFLNLSYSLYRTVHRLFSRGFLCHVFLQLLLCYCYKWCCVIVTSHRGQNMRLLCLGLTLNLLVAQEKKERGKWY